MTTEFLIDGQEPAEAPFIYKMSGLDDVVLLNGFTIEETEYGRGVSIDNIEQLHQAIALHIITTKKVLSAKEFLFLRREMGMTQEQLATALGIDGQTVARYEKGATPPSGPADRLVRHFYVLQLLPEQELRQLLDEVKDAVSGDEIAPSAPARFQEVSGTWEEVFC